VNATHAREFLTAAAACDAASDYSGPRELVDAVAPALPGAEWEFSFRGGDPASLRLGLLVCGDSASGRTALARALDVDEEDLVGEPAAGRPWVDASWDMAGGRWRTIETARADGRGAVLRVLRPKAGPPRRLVERPFSAAVFPEPIGSGLATFHALSPIRAVQSAPGRPGWTLALLRPLPWPLLLRCDVSAALAPRAAQLSLLLRDARVVALDFDGEALWARLVG
jgi:hypothetical protein